MNPDKNLYHKTVTNFLKTYLNPKTHSNYRIAIAHYLKFHTVPDRNGKYAEIDILAKRYLTALKNGNRNHLKDLRHFAQYLGKTYAPTTASLYFTCVCIWLDDMGYPVTRKDRFRVSAQLPPPYPIENDIELKRKTFRAIYNELPEETGVLFLVLLSSGMRIGEALLLRKSNIIWSGKRTEIILPAEITKTKTTRRTFISSEASIRLLDYLRKRSDRDDKLFLFSYSKVSEDLRKASYNLGITRTVHGKKMGVHWHMTRKWFLSRFSLAASREIAEHLAGHEGYLSRAYRRYSRKQLLKEYLKAEKKLTILKESDS